ncbi:MAG: bifunctional folylpolyglutamate synthase/dihydrofolate synthase [Planctomycetota bacterium]|nr:bifunctional folylpolyglutamate synthase/dihydrofolate synthase [Planctomycetota bacterium]
MAFATYEAALEYLFSATDYEKMQHVRYNADTFSLDRMRQMVSTLGSPETKFPSIHVAGTKGKGSTAAMIHALATAAGLKVGLYTSPHLVDIRERIRVGREDISKEALRLLIEGARSMIERLRNEGAPATFFEIFTALAFKHFADQKVDLGVIEAGMGGRLDATNVIVPDVSVITAISIDHTEQLGHTLLEIAAEKAGIIKTRVTCVTQPQEPEVLDLIENACQQAGAPMILVGRDISCKWEPAEEKGRLGGRMVIDTHTESFCDLFIPLMGQHQAVNACAAIAAARRTAALKKRLAPKVIAAGLRAVQWPGRMEYVPGQPDMLLDGAHNRSSLERLMEGLVHYFPGWRLILVFACAADKDVDGMMAVLAQKAAGAPIVFTKSRNPRACEPADLAARFAALGGAGAQTAPDLPAALAAAKGLAGPAGLVVVAGSLYLVGEAKQLPKKK